MKGHARAGVPGLVLLLGLALAPAAAAQSTLIHLNSQPGDYIGGGTEQTITPAQGAFSAGQGANNVVTVSFQAPNPSNWWTFRFAPLAGEVLTPGVYEGATRWPFQGPSHPGLDVSGNGAGCNRLEGRFVVLEAVYAGSAVTQFAADFEQHCDGLTPALFGSVRFNSAVPVTRRLSVSGAKAIEDKILARLTRFNLRAGAAESQQSPTPCTPNLHCN